MQISPETYKMMASQHQRLKAMKQGQFVQWACAFWKDAHDEGYEEGKAAGKEKIPADATVIDIDSLYDLLISVKGIGHKRAEQVMQKLMEDG